MALVTIRPQRVVGGLVGELLLIWTGDRNFVFLEHVSKRMSEIAEADECTA